MNQVHKHKNKYKKWNINIKTKEKKYIKLTLSTKGPKTYSPFLLQIAKGKVNRQRVEEMEKHFYTPQNLLSMMQLLSTTHPEATCVVMKDCIII